MSFWTFVLNADLRKFGTTEKMTITKMSTVTPTIARMTRKPRKPNLTAREPDRLRVALLRALDHN